MQKLIVVSLLLSAAWASAEDKVVCTIANGPFKADMDSLKQYRCPDWFRDAKFGIWAHWGPQAVPITSSTTDIPQNSATRTSSPCGRRRSGTRTA